VSASRGPTMRLHFVMVGELLAVSRTARGISLQVRLDRLELVHGKPVRLLWSTPATARNVQERHAELAEHRAAMASHKNGCRAQHTRVPHGMATPASLRVRWRRASSRSSHQGHDGQIRRAEGSGGAGGPPAGLPRSTEFELKVYSQHFCRAYYAFRNGRAIRSLTRRRGIVNVYARRGKPDVVSSSSARARVRIRLEACCSA
jgi:hypothetical protein